MASAHAHDLNPNDRHYLADVVPLGSHPAPRPNRVNFAGFCLYCLQQGCESPSCILSHSRSTWDTCRTCEGTGMDEAGGDTCHCEGGLSDITGSTWINSVRPRPHRLNYAGYCLFCTKRWCYSRRCIERHVRSTWGLCDVCEGVGFVEGGIGMCDVCVNGLIETTPLRGGKG